MSENKPLFGGMKISLGGAKSSNSIKLPSRPPPKSSLGKRAALHDDSDSENDAPKEVAVTEFGATGAKSKNEQPAKKVLVIPAQSNSFIVGKAGRGEVLPAEEVAPRNGEGQEEGVLGGKDKVKSVQKFGLQVMSKEEGEAEALKRLHADRDSMRDAPPAAKEETEDEKPMTAEERAIHELTHGKVEKKQPDMAIEHPPRPISEAEAYKKSVETAPEPSTLEDYERIPVESFGAALLRGQGWDGAIRERPALVKKRPAQMGLGANAKEIKELEELGAWDHKAGLNGKRRTERKETPSQYQARKEMEDRMGREDKEGPRYGLSGKERRERDRELGSRDFRKTDVERERERKERGGGGNRRDDRGDDRDARGSRDYRRDDRSGRDNRGSRDYRDRDRDSRRDSGDSRDRRDRDRDYDRDRRR